MADISDITKYLSATEVLAQLGEKGAELGQAALKLRRAMDGSNPTPKSVKECTDNLVEEFADMMLCVRVVCEATNTDFDDFLDDAAEIMVKKCDRWATRLEDNATASYLVYVGTEEPLNDTVLTLAINKDDAADRAKRAYHKMHPDAPLDLILCKVTAAG